MLYAEAEFSALSTMAGVFGGLALFLYGMQEMSAGLKAAAGDGMKRLLNQLTTNRFTAAGTGAAVTALIQSSSVTTVLVVGFVSAGLMSLQQSVGVIMGANVGTTVTAQIVAFKVTSFSWVMVSVGFLLTALSRRDQFRDYGTMLLGLGLLFLGMDQMSHATEPLRSYEPFIELMRKTEQPLVGVILGAAFTALVQSSSATTGIIVLLASQGFLTLEGGIALALGANIGTCFTAALAAIGKPVDAARAAAVHIIFNVVGTCLWIGFIPQLAEVAIWLSPVAESVDGIAKLGAETPRQVANANTIFNLANTLILIWFVGPIAHLATKLVPNVKNGGKSPWEPKFLDPVFLQTPSLALDRVSLEMETLGKCVARMLDATPFAVVAGTRQDLERLTAMDDDVDRLYLSIVDYLRLIGREELTTEESTRLGALLRVANYLENTGDLVESRLVSLGIQRANQNLQFSDRTLELMRPLQQEITEMMKLAVQAVVENDRSIAMKVINEKDRVHAMADSLTVHLGNRLLVNAPNRSHIFGLESEFVSHLRRVFYNSRRIAKLVVSI